jgi:sporulation protein YhbH
MSLFNIQRDHARFKNIIKGKIKQDLKKYISNGDMIVRKGKDTVSIPMPQIEIPRFKFGSNEGGVGQGEGKPGDEVDPNGQPQDGKSGQGAAGDQPGEHSLEVDLTLAELAEILADELELPRIEPKGKEILEKDKDRYTGIAHQGPNSLRNFKRSFQEALKRQIASGSYDPDNPLIVPIRRDMRFRSWKTTQEFDANAVIIYMMDVSGSMGDEQKEIVRTESFWLDTWLRSQYKGLETRYIIHDTVAREVDEKTFYSTRESGGTLISSAYKLCQKLIETEYPSEQWNIYPFHFSDGDNWSGEDTKLCFDLLQNQLFPKINMFCYGQVESRYGSGQFLKDLQEQFKEGNEKLALSKIENKEGIMKSIKDFLGKGK